MADDHKPLEALNARGLTAKREYVRGLEQRRDAEALSLLVECLCDESWFLRDLAEQAFVRMGEEHAGPLLPLLTGGLWYTRLSAARLLGRLGFRPAVPALLELCADANETVSLAARDALMSVARQRGASRIAHALHRLPPERKRERLAEFAQRDRVLAKNLERLMTDATLMSSAQPDRLVDEEEGAKEKTAGGAHPQATDSKTKAAAAPMLSRKPAAEPKVAPAPKAGAAAPESNPAKAAASKTPSPKPAVARAPAPSPAADGASDASPAPVIAAPKSPAKTAAPASAPKPEAEAVKTAAASPSAPKPEAEAVKTAAAPPSAPKPEAEAVKTGAAPPSASKPKTAAASPSAPQPEAAPVKTAAAPPPAPAPGSDPKAPAAAPASDSPSGG